MLKGLITEKKPRSEKQLLNDAKCRERMQEFHKNKSLKNEPVITTASVEDVKPIETIIKPKVKKGRKQKTILEEEQPINNIEVVF